MKMQHSMGELTEAVKGLKERQAEQAKKLDRISHQMYAAIVVLTLVGGIFWYFANSINSLITQLISNSAQQQQQQASPQPTALPKKTS
jgi:type VI protein secretion system component VasK